MEMLSGDTTAAAEQAATKVGITRATGGLSPQQKAERIAAIKAGQRDGGSDVFVGDGVNDAPALASADVGIAMGSGADVALETADITLLSGGLTAVPRAVDLARATMTNVRQNLGLAFLSNLLALPVAAGLLYPLLGHVTSPMLAAAAMSLSSLSVIANSLRLRRLDLDTSTASAASGAFGSTFVVGFLRLTRASKPRAVSTSTASTNVDRSTVKKSLRRLAPSSTTTCVFPSRLKAR